MDIITWAAALPEWATPLLILITAGGSVGVLWLRKRQKTQALYENRKNTGGILYLILAILLALIALFFLVIMVLDTIGISL